MTKIPKKDSNGNFSVVVVNVQDNTMAWKLSGNYFASFLELFAQQTYFVYSHANHVI